MADSSSLRGIRNSALFGAVIIALACGLQAVFAPTVRVTCPARTAAAPDCDLRWLVAFDRLTVRHTPLPALKPVGEIEQTAPTRRGGATTLFLDTAAGRVRTIMWGEHLSLQALRDPLRKYFADPHAPALDVTMWPTIQTADDYHRPHPMRQIANVLVVLGLLCWLWLPVQLAVAIAQRLRA